VANNISTCSLQNMLTAILSQANQDQNMQYPPFIYQSQFNSTTSLLISELVAAYSDKPEVVDILLPFIAVARIPVGNGIVPLPTDYRNILGSPSIYVNNQASAECAGEIAPVMTPQQFAVANLKGGCQRRPIRIVSQSEFDYLTTSTYKAPTYNDPIGFFTSATLPNGPVVKAIKICPYDLTKVDLLYVQQEPTFIYGYILQPDDTYIQNPGTTTESIWTSAAFKPFFNAMNMLYSIYARDKELTDWSALLKERGIL
jgi:hypothetical protein